MTSYVIHALVQKRSELSGDIENTHNALKRMIQELEHLDKTLLMFDPTYQVEAIKPEGRFLRRSGRARRCGPLKWPRSHRPDGLMVIGCWR